MTDETEELKRTIERLKGRVAELEQLADQQREWIEDTSETLGTYREWLIEPADEEGMVQSRLGTIIDQYNSLVGEYNKLLGKHRRLISEWNRRLTPPVPGRPIEASDDQQEQVRKLRKSGRSLRGIALDTGLSFKTVRTVVDHMAGKSAKAKGDHLKRERELGRLRQAEARARKKAKDSAFSNTERLLDESKRLKRSA